MIRPTDAFSESIISEVSSKRQWSNVKISARQMFLPLLFIVFFVVLISRTFYLQIVKGSYYRGLSDSNRTKTVVIHAPRGIIFDRNQKPLVYNIPGFRENVNGKTIFVPQEKALEQIAKGKNNLEIDTLRKYQYRDAVSHVLGFLGQISEDQLKDPLFSDYAVNDVLGKDGIERVFEAKLKGVDGRELFEIDAKGNTIRNLGRDEPVAGENVTLTLDIDLQLKTYEAAKDIKKGAVIVSTPKGEILALVSKPSFDPNLFTLGEDYKAATDSAYKTLESILLDFENQPLLNRSISGTYPPGSTFKIVVASAALQNNIIDENFEVEDTGVLKIGEFSFANWYYTGYGGKDGFVNVVKGIKRSNDIFFYKLAEKTGIDTISDTAGKFGVGKNLGIDLVGEEKGVLPTVEWKERVIKEQWYLGDTYHYGIGQGFLLTTPLQVNAWAQAIANKGVLFRPHLLKNEKPYVLEKDLLDDKPFSLIREGMIESCAPTGVAWPLFNFKVKNANLKVDGRNILAVDPASGSADMRKIVVACKTGTAETTPNQKPHAWITLFAPAYNPQVIITVLSENSGEGSNVAAPIAKKILEAWFSK
ncbi:MAG: hypothetical protein HY344_03620 [Candidatus Levybacteria bacterium]|nr:hypothetical protein [Candidatus Levybacteria bacterium]